MIMLLVIGLLAISIILELLIYSLNYLWDRRKVLVSEAIFCAVVSSLLLVIGWPNIFSYLVLLINCFRIISMLRILIGQTEVDYLFRNCRKTALWLTLYQIITVSLWLGYYYLGRQNTLHNTLLYFVVLQFLSTGTLLWSIRRSIIKTRLPNKLETLPEYSFPTLSVCIPARNETTDLYECLQSLVINNYPKLEILVLDDCSQTRHTADIIRSFAQDGVQFIKGKQPPKSWLAKNWAYQRLLSEANGEIVLFCGVDIKFGPETLELLVATLLKKKKTMLSVMPKRLADNILPLAQSMRYYWELAPPRRFFNRPPVLSSCWIANRKSLLNAGGFAAVQRAIVPEAFFARTFIKHDGYSFLRSNEKLNLTSTKSIIEQRATAIRTRYPQLHKRLELVLLFLISEFWFLFCPFLIFIIGFWYQPFGLIHILSFITSLLLVVSYSFVVMITMPRAWLSSLLCFPLVVATDMGMLVYSMLLYNFSTVEWKSRDIRVPVMRLKYTNNKAS
jgi:glycosyltransferase involved in cell wall biosynthesis